VFCPLPTPTSRKSIPAAANVRRGRRDHLNHMRVEIKIKWATPIQIRRE
jgi:hypothetical protein